MRLAMRRRKGSRSSATLPLDHGVSTKQVTAMVVAMALAVVLYPAGVRAAQNLAGVVVTDPGGANKAKVDASGNLQIGGTVIVGNTPNLQVGGTVNVGNTPGVNASQSGTWNVGINGTPTVNVAGTPSVNIAGTPVVTSGDETTVLSSGSRYLFEAEYATLVYHLDATSAKDIRLYIDAPDFAVGDLTFTILSQSPEGTEFIVDSFGNQDPTTGLNTRLYDLLGPTLSVQCHNTNNNKAGTVSWMLVSRSN